MGCLCNALASKKFMANANNLLVCRYTRSMLLRSWGWRWARQCSTP